MPKGLKLLVSAILGFFIIHLMRDLFQDFGIGNLLSEILVKSDQSNVPGWYWKVFNPYLLEILGIITGSISLKQNRFKPFGLISLLLAVSFWIVWSIYWFLM